MSTKVEATIEDLYKVEGKAELVNGEIILMSPTGFLPNHAAGQIYLSLCAYAEKHETGLAFTDNTAFVVDLPHRKSFSPDTGVFSGEYPMRFARGAPIFAVEVRSDGDYGPRAERQMAQKRADYFAAGTLVVWDVDLLSDDVVRVYRASESTIPTIYKRGQLAEAEPALPSWSISVDNLFYPRKKTNN